MLLRPLVFALAVCAAAPAMAQEPAPAPNMQLESLMQKISYIIGRNIGQGLKADEIAVDFNILAAGIRDGLEGRPSVLTDEDIQAATQAFQMQLAGEEANQNMEEGRRFLAGNAQKEGIVTLPSGLQYEVIKAGTGATPGPNDSVTTHYRGMLLTGEEFDSSYGRGQPATFGVSRVIKGWTEALQRMKVGDHWRLFVPAELAYGAQGTPDGSIPPNSVLVFEVELLDVKPTP